jgi:SAM-dependent methyltransferase
MRDFSKVEIDKPAISIFGSGDSIHDLRADDIGIIKGETYTIFTNLIDIFTPHMRVWVDSPVTRYFDNNPPDIETLVCAKNAFEKGKRYNDIHKKVHYQFDRSDKMFDDGSFTFYYIFQLIKHYFPDKPVLLFGMDCLVNKMYEVTPDNKVVCVEDSKKQARHLGMCPSNQNIENLPNCMRRYCGRYPDVVKNVYNCSPISTVECFQKIRYLDVIMKECS